MKRWTYATALTPVSELDVQSGRMKTFVYASRGNVPDLMTVREGATVTTYRFATDHLGSVRMVVNASCPQTFADAYASCVVWHADYDEYGRQTPVKQNTPDFVPFGFAGGMFDYETGLTRFGARDYDAQVGRWTAKDPIRFRGGQANLFVYVGNDPINLRDPSGLLEVAVGTSVEGTFGWGPSVNFGTNGEFATNRETGLYRIVPTDNASGEEYGASIGIGVNVALGEDGATWDGPFENWTGGPVTVFWSAAEGPKYYGIEFSVGIGWFTGLFYNDYRTAVDEERAAAWWARRDKPCP